MTRATGSALAIALAVGSASAAHADPLQAEVGFDAGMGVVDDPSGADPLLGTFGLRAGVSWWRLNLLGGIDFVSVNTGATAMAPARYAAAGRALVALRFAVLQRQYLDDRLGLSYQLDVSAGELVHHGGPAAALGDRDVQAGASVQVDFRRQRGGYDSYGGSRDEALPVRQFSGVLGIMLVFPDGHGPTGAIVSVGYRWGKPE